MSAQSAVGFDGFYWSDRAAWGGRRPPALVLVGLRRAAAQPPGTSPSMWPYLSTLTRNGFVGDDLHAEHIALGIFAAHQRVRRDPVHVQGREFAAVLGRVRAHDPGMTPGLDRRFAAAATSATRTELATHLHSLIARLRPLRKSGFDYDQLYQDIRDWEDQELSPQIRRRWESRYFIAERASAGHPVTAFLTSLNTQELHGEQ
ncbi:type I-E CRISPR-associated protein Cse2/CasB [Nocardia brasiliensis]|uniref:type I-E CRISPR-associated protein Cse2/CasB n=1 Tax=Nocardia brasiliensis TaxID=37326 RepID=UPI0037932E2C